MLWRGTCEGRSAFKDYRHLAFTAGYYTVRFMFRKKYPAPGGARLCDDTATPLALLDLAFDTNLLGVNCVTDAGLI